MKNKRLIRRDVYEGLLFLGMAGGLWLKIIYTQLSTKINKVPIWEDENKAMFWMALWSVLVVMLFLAVLWKKRPLILPTIGAVILGLLMWADTLYGRYYYNPTTISILNQLYMAGDVAKSAISLLKPKDIIFVMDLVILLFVIAGRSLFKLKLTERTTSNRPRLIALGLVLVFALVFNQGYQELDRTNYQYERKNIAKDLGLIYYHGFDIVDGIQRSFGSVTLTQEELTVVAEANNAGTKDNLYTGAAEGYNLIVIQVEAFMDFLIDYEVDGVEVTPYLNRLKEASFYGPNLYYQTAGGNTVDAELMMNTSLLPSESGAVYYEYPTNTYPSLPLLLEKEGYRSYSFHGYEASFWNREIMHKTLGFERFFSMDDFDVDEKIGWAISDASFYQQSLAKTLEASEGNPFYSFMITLSSHHPYDGFLEGPFTGTEGSEGMLNHYYNAGAYVDETIKGLVVQLIEEGLYDNTMIVIYGDHGAVFGDVANQQMTLDGVEPSPFNWTAYEQVPLIIHAPGVFDEGLRHEDVAGQVDIMPTVMNLLGVETVYTIGNDLLEPTYEGLVVKRYGNVITNEMVYMADKNQVFNRLTGAPVSLKTFERQINQGHHLLEINDMILSSDYFKEWE